MSMSQSLFSQPRFQIPRSLHDIPAALASLNTESSRWRQLSALVGSKNLRQLLENRYTTRIGISSLHSVGSIEANGWEEFDEAVELVDDPQGGSSFQIRSNGRECVLPDMIIFGSQADGDRFTIWIEGHTVTLRWDELQEFLELWQGRRENKIGVASRISWRGRKIDFWRALNTVGRYARLG